MNARVFATLVASIALFGCRTQDSYDGPKAVLAPSTVGQARALARSLPATASRLAYHDAFAETAEGLRTRSDFGATEPHLVLPRRAADPWTVAVGTGAPLVTLRLKGVRAGEVPGGVEDGVIRYEAAMEGVDWLFTQAKGGAETLFLVHDNFPGTHFEARFSVVLPKGVKAHLESDGLVVERGSQEFFSIAPPTVVDARGEKRPGTIDFVTRENGEKELSFSVDLQGLSAPFLVDPAVTTFRFLAIGATGPRVGHSASLDRDRGKIVFVGGTRGGSDYVKDTVEYDGRFFRNVPVVPGDPVAAASSAYDEIRKRTIVFGGLRTDKTTNELYLWNGVGWANVPVHGVWPRDRGVPAMGWSQAQKGVIIHGGITAVNSAIGAAQDTFVWDGTDFRQLGTFQPEVPYAGSAIAVDPSRDEVVLFGGYTGATIDVGKRSDLAFHLVGTRWEPLPITAGSPAPIGRANHIFVYDETGKRYLMLGGVADAKALLLAIAGFGTAPAFLDDVWELKGPDAAGAYTWRKLPFTSPGLVAVAGAYDPRQAGVVFTGGFRGNNTASADTYLIKGDTLTLLKPSDTPTSAVAMGGTYSAVAGGVLLFGGRDASGAGSVYSDKLFLWDGARLGEVPVTGTKPPNRLEPGFVTMDDGSVLLHGGFNDQFKPIADTWKFEPGTKTWTKLADGPIRSRQGFAWDPVRKVALLFGGESTGGTYEGDTWEFDPAKNSWTKLTTAVAPSPRRQVSMIFEPKRGKVFLYGGQVASADANADTWEYDPAVTAWKMVETGTGPGGLNESPMTYNTLLGLPILFGGQAVIVSDKGYAFDGKAWQVLDLGPAANRPTQRRSHVFVHDPLHGETYLYGGAGKEGSGDVSLKDQWVLRVAGYGCAADTDCALGAFCTDGVCCESKACAGCESCAGIEPGRCTPIARNIIDPKSCTGANACNGNSRCAGALGGTCKVAADCASGFCVSGVCCDSECDASKDCVTCVATDQATPTGVGVCGRKKSGLCTDGACTRAQDCAVGYVCGANARCVPVAPSLAADDESGCAVQAPSATSSAGFAGVALSLVAVARRRRVKRGRK
jgi:hypothetical protein